MASCRIASKSDERCEISRMERPEPLRSSTAWEACSKTVLGSMEGPGEKLIIFGMIMIRLYRQIYMMGSEKGDVQIEFFFMNPVSLSSPSLNRDRSKKKK